MQLGRKQKLIDGYEYDHLYAKKIYCYLINPDTVRFIKRKMNRRYRQELKHDTRKELEEVEI